MTLRQRLVLVHTSFAVFALLAAIATIYAVQHQIQRAARQFETLVDEVSHLDRCRSDVQTLDVHLHELLAGTREADEDFVRYASGVVTRLREVAQFSSPPEPAGESAELQLRALVERLDVRLDQMLEIVGSRDMARAQTLFKTEIESELLERIQAALRRQRQEVESSRRHASLSMLRQDSRMLLLAGAVGVAGVALVVAGMLIVRRRLVQPIEVLQATARTFAAGDLSHRADLPIDDELGQLAGALNGMAGALQRSQRKYRSLFENLRDTVVICDPGGVIREAHGGDAALLPKPAEQIVGSRIESVWPEAVLGELTWDSLFERVRRSDRPVRLTDIRLHSGSEASGVVDVVAYRVSYEETEFAAVVLRDVTERRRLQRAAQRAETMEAAVNFARGIAHDFKNLLHSVQISLTGISEQTDEERTRARAGTATEACRQAASLAKRLSRFSSADEGQPEILRIADTTRMIVDALDRELFAGVDVRLELNEDASVFVDRDQFTQILLNLVYNALEAMGGRGTLTVALRSQSFANPLTGRSASPHIVLSVTDSGVGISPEALERVFEPLFSTKERSSAGPRGMGLAVVYAAVTCAGGFVQIDSVPGKGTEVSVYLPIAPTPASRQTRSS